MSEETKLAPISDQLHRAIDHERSKAYSAGATEVWRSLGVGDDLPNEAVFDEAAQVFVVQPKPRKPSP